jgi:hypothetical protein
MFAFMLLIILGGMSNLNAVASNGGKMPVLSNYAWESNTHFGYLDSSEINFPQLVDRFQIKGNDWTFSFSIGDVFIYLFSPVILFLVGKLVYLEIKYRKVYKDGLV